MAGDTYQSCGFLFPDITLDGFIVWSKHSVSVCSLDRACQIVLLQSKDRAASEGPAQGPGRFTRWLCREDGTCNDIASEDGIVGHLVQTGEEVW